MENFNYMELLAIKEAVVCRIADVEITIENLEIIQRHDWEGNKKVNSELLDTYRAKKCDFEELLNKVQSVKKTF